MALYRTSTDGVRPNVLDPDVARRRAARRRVAPIALGAATVLIVLTGCDNLSYRRLDYDNTEAARITTIRVLPGAGDVVVRASGTASEVRIKRVVRYQGGVQPDAKYQINGSELVLDADCGSRCSVSYEVTAPEGVGVTGETGSGDVELSRVGTVQLRLGSGNVQLTGASGAVRVETGSGDIEVSEVAGPLNLRASSGNITARRLTGQVDAEANSGDVEVELDQPVSARAHASSGNVNLVVPAGRYRVRSSTGSGDANLGVADDPTASLVLDVSAGSGDVSISQR
ncbi:DUF4097 family beta strand repeat-containing protein [Micromonospora sp. WMMD812]|uniref:DUF4097 family beta strand repeat-containing protein n=1 Tax=Micromonospora sp. WMMD812 TaxID=3015152 RepID=UPI00248B9536|nr:DUF4097 family beta strand repeat-containing protein [Micromonospora sp. WMMD812]WBB66944.1 DUF4097 family beta strand repeat-containing protein [Micromonospora sp. WMMD812]